MNKHCKVTIKAGERFFFSATDAFCIVASGEAELYAKTLKKNNYQQLFVVEKKSGEFIFPLFDEFDMAELFLYAVTPVTIELYSLDAIEKMSAEEEGALYKGMQEWFRDLMTISWIRLLANKGDDMLNMWSEADFLTATNSLWTDFLTHQHILAMLIGGQFQAEERFFGQSRERREQQKVAAFDEAIGSLLDKEHHTGVLVHGSTQLGEAAFVVEAVVTFFKLNIKRVTLPQEIAKKLDPFDILRRLVKKAGMQMRLIELEKDWYKKDSGTIIGYYGDKKTLCAFLPQTPVSYALVSRENPDGMVITDEVAASIDPRAFECYAGFAAKSLSVKDVIIFMFERCWKSDYYTIILASFIAGLIPLITPLITEKIFSDIIPIQDRKSLATIVQVMMIAGFTTAALSLVRSIASLRIGSRLGVVAETALWIRLLSLPTDFFKRFRVGELVERINGIKIINQFITGEFVGQVFGTVFSIWSLLLMCYYSLKLTFLAICIWVVYLLITAFIYRQLITVQKNIVRTNNATAGQVLQIISGLSKFRIKGLEAQAFSLWAQKFGDNWKWRLKYRWQNNYSTVLNTVQPLLLTLILYYAAVNWSSEGTGTTALTMTYPEFLGFQAAFSAFNAALVSMIPVFMNLFTITPQIENLKPILEEIPEITDDKIDADVLSGAIQVSNLSFSYNKEGPEIIKDVSFEIASGMSVAIVGPSGCGKSTLLRILLGFEKPRYGAVYYDGIDLQELSVASVRAQMGVVLQNGQLMSGDIFTNIIGTTSLTIEDAWDAARKVGLDKDIESMPMGMYTMISEGASNISGGQKQRILIARSLANKPRMMILDEATSALDNTTQAIVTESLRNMKCTKIIVAHRLSTIKDADKILVLDKGKIVEQGNFAELMQENGLFALLAKRQLM